MSDELESTQPSTPAELGGTKPNAPYQEPDTQPVKKAKKPTRWRSILISALGFLFLISLSGFGGYNSAIGARKNAEKAAIIPKLSEQYSLALVDIQFGRYENAQQRLEYVLQHDPNFPGAKEKLAEVFAANAMPTPAPTDIPVTPSPTPDFSGVENALARAQESIRAQDWVGALSALDMVRKLDSSYHAAQTDAMYYFALRNRGYDLITKEGNLEGGIYYITLAERFGPLDNSAKGLRDGARSYMVGASFWELNWEQAASYFESVAAGWPSLWDGTMTAANRYFVAAVHVADNLLTAGNACAAYEQYQKAAAYGTLEGQAANNASQAYNTCYPPTAEATAIPPTVAATLDPSTPTPEPPTLEPTAVPNP
ncbi:MAG: hypothetical protein LC099_04550 [Anaerolineales bacterium]|nr:hypothetical protein [Anaerolineales bacterium]